LIKQSHKFTFFLPLQVHVNGAAGVWPRGCVPARDVVPLPLPSSPLSIIHNHSTLSGSGSEKRMDGRAIAQAVNRRLPKAAARVPAQVRSYGIFVLDKVALGQAFGFPCQLSFHRLIHTHLSSGAGTIGQLMADVPSGLSHPTAKKLKKN
jgi:hypothetical protein